MNQSISNSDRLRSLLVATLLPAAICFLVINITNDRLLPILIRHHLSYGDASNLSQTADKTIRFYLVPLKSCAFFLLTGILGLQIAPEVRSLAGNVRRRSVVQTGIAIAVCMLLIATIAPLSFGRSYARISTDPFNQVPDQLYRRLLIPGLSYLYHVNGFLFAGMTWALVFAVILATKIYLEKHGHMVSLAEEISLLTVGLFAAAFQFPGYPETAVILLALIALMNHESHGEFTRAQLAAFCLALMAHEACAVIVFAPLILFIFGRRSWIPCGLAVALYATTVFLDFSNPLDAIRIQGYVSTIPAPTYLTKSLPTDLWAIFFSFKLFWIFVPLAIYRCFGQFPRKAFFIIATFILSIGCMYIAVDYTRMIGFATLAMILCLQEAKARLSSRIFNLIILANILVPTLYVGGNSGIVAMRGLYRWEAHKVFRLN